MKRIGFAALCGFVLICTLAGCGSTSPRGSPSAGTAGATTTAPPAATGGSSPTTGTPPSDQATGSTPAPTTTSASTTTSTTTTPAINTSVVPRVITVAYVDAVLAKLDAIRGDALRSAVAAGRVTTSAIHDYYAAFSPTLANQVINGISDAALHHFPYIKRHPGNQRTVVIRLLIATSSCIFMLVNINNTAVTSAATSNPAYTYEGLAPRGPLNSGEGDPTAWSIFYARGSTKPLRSLPCA